MQTLEHLPEQLLESPTPTKRTLVCIPAFNEEENIPKVLENLLSFQTSDFHYDILVINDGSTDETARVCSEHGVSVISHIYNVGYGAALKTAYKFAVSHEYDFIIQMDADGQHDVSNIQRIYEAFSETEDTDIIIGSRFMQESVSFHIPIHKKFAIGFFRKIIKLSTSNEITDPTSGLQGLNRRAFAFYAKFDNFAMDYPDANMIIQMALNNFTVKEIPAVMHVRLHGESMHSGFYRPIKYIIIMMLSTLIVIMRERIKRK